MNTSNSQLSSLYHSIDITQEIPPLIVGERTNPTGSKKFRELLLANDFDGCLQVAVEQEKIGAHVLDLSAAWAGRNEEEDLVTLVKLFSQNLRIPLMIDSTSPDCIEKALMAYPGRPVINSINFEDGGTNLHKVCSLAKKYGACVVALTIDEDGMAMDAKKKFDIAERIFNVAVNQYGLAPSDIFFDPLTFTVGSGDNNLVDAAIQTLEAIRLIKEKLVGAKTILGLSNISFGLRPPARKVLNAVFLHEAVEAGLDAVIINPTNCISLDTIKEESRRLALDLLYNRQTVELSPLMTYIAHFENSSETAKKQEETEFNPEQQLFACVLQGSRKDIYDLLHILMDKYRPLEIINQLLVPAMKRVGELFGAGEMLLPFVLQSAEVMRSSVEILEPYMDKNSKNDAPKVLLATVQGDVHDIGKNLVNIILSNNGYDVIDIGIKVSAERIIEEAQKHNVDLIALSGLLVKSAVAMRDSIPLFKEAGLTQPILLGGAALTRKFVATECAVNYPSQVVYCKDAFAGLKALQDMEKGELTSTTWNEYERKDSAIPGAEQLRIQPAENIPTPAAFGTTGMKAETKDFIDLVKTNFLFRGRWGYVRGNKSKEEYQDMLEKTVLPQYHAIRDRILSEDLLEPKINYGWFSCYKEKDTLYIDADSKTVKFTFPRQQNAPHRSLADYFNNKGNGADVVGFFVATIGSKINEITQDLYQKGEFHDYLLLHGYSVEAAEALAEYTHTMMRSEIGLQGTGKRFSFGYSACPDLNLQKPLLKLLRADEIGIKLTESLEMTPEQSVSAMVVHHSQASYFSV